MERAPYWCSSSAKEDPLCTIRIIRQVYTYKLILDGLYELCIMGLPWRWRSTSKELAPLSAQTSATLRPMLPPVLSSPLPLARVNSFASYHMLLTRPFASAYTLFRARAQGLLPCFQRSTDSLHRDRGRGGTDCKSPAQKQKGHANACPVHNPALSRAELRAGTLRKAPHCLSFRVVNVENRQQLGDLQHFLKLAAQVAQLQPRSLRFRAVVRRHQRPQPRAVDERHIVHIQHDLLFSGGDQALHFFAKRVALFAEHDAAVQRHHCHAIHFAVRHLQSHVLISSSVAVPAATRPVPQHISNSPRKTCNSRTPRRSVCSAAIPAAGNKRDNSARRLLAGR